MELGLARYSDNGESTLGLLFEIGDRFQCYTLEDQAQAEKVAGETRIPAGRYEIRFREVLSPMTERYRARFDWFTWHLELQDVPGFLYVYVHIGNDADDTDACILVGDQPNNNQRHTGFLGSSTPAFEVLYRKIAEALQSGERVFITIADDVQSLFQFPHGAGLSRP